MDFDVNLLRSAVTLLSFAGFLAIVAWAYGRRSRQQFEEAAQLTFLEDGEASNPKLGGTHE